MGSLASTCNKKGKTCCRACDVPGARQCGQYTRPERKAGENGFDGRKLRCCIFKRGGHGRNAEVFGAKADGTSRKAVGFMKYNGDIQPAGCEYRRETGITSRGKKECRAVLFKETSASEESQNVGQRFNGVEGLSDWSCSGFQEWTIPCFGGFCFGNARPGENQYKLMSLLAELVCHCHCGMDMAACPAAGDCNRRFHLPQYSKCYVLCHDCMGLFFQNASRKLVVKGARSSVFLRCFRCRCEVLCAWALRRKCVCDCSELHTVAEVAESTVPPGCTVIKEEK